MTKLKDFMDKVYNTLRKGNLPPFCFWALEKQGNTGAPIVMFDANPEVVTFLPTLGSDFHKIYPSHKNPNKSLVYIQEEICKEFCPMQKCFHLLSCDMRVIDGGFIHIKIKTEAITMYLSFKKDKISNLRQSTHLNQNIRSGWQAPFSVPCSKRLWLPCQNCPLLPTLQPKVELRQT